MGSYTSDNTIKINLKSNDHGLNSTVEIKGGNDTIYTLACRSIHLKKEIYKVGYIDIEYILNGYGDLQTNDYISEIKDYFFPYSVDSNNNKTYYKCLVNISSPLLGTTTSIAKDYVVRDVKLRFVKREMTDNVMGKDIVITKNVMAVQVRAYSPDYCLTQKKFSRVYRGQKLSTIIRELTGEAGISGYFPAYEDLCFCNTTAPASFKDKDTDKEPTLHDNYPLEILQPYLVQYNETMHDFLVRVAHRCGELFYYEDGKLILGVDQKYISGISKTDKHEKTTDRDDDNNGVAIYKFTNADIIVDDKKKVSMIKGDITLSDGQILLTDDFYTDKDLLKNVKAPSSDVCDESVCLDEALYEVTTNDANTFGSITEAHWFEPGHEAFKADGLASLFTNAGTKAADIAIQGGFALTDTEVQFKDEIVKSEMKYSSKLTDNKKKNLTNEFYNWMRQCQKKISAGMQEHHSTEVNMNEGLMLGEFVTIDGLNAENKNLYYVYSVDIDLNTSFSVKPEVKAQYDVDVKIQYCPVCTCYGRIGKEDSTQLPYQTKIFPPLADIPFIRKAEPQQAIVKNIADPLRNGRVQIQYPWETSGKATNSPWLHIAEPFTGQKDSGFLMTPDADDTVMVHYEGGNIERPYIDGSLFRGDKGKTNWGDTAVSNVQLNYTKAHRAITSNGNGITFMNGNAGVFAGSMLPSLLSGALMWGEAGKDNNRLGGGLILSDYYGMYSIAMSSGSRSISIDSPWGKVDINAFTGITLSAPNGDIKISGKNVTIEAGNKVSITSGKNIKNAKTDAWKEAAKIGGTIIGSVAKSAMVGATKTFLKFDVTKLADVSFLRSVYEIIMRPVDGSLTITSKRNVMVQAGKGKVSTPASYLSNTTMGSTKFASEESNAFTKALFPSSTGKSQQTIANENSVTTPKQVASLINQKCSQIDSAVNAINTQLATIAAQLEVFKFYQVQRGEAEGKIKKDEFKNDDSILSEIVKPNYTFFEDPAFKDSDIIAILQINNDIVNGQTFKEIKLPEELKGEDKNNQEKLKKYNTDKEEAEKKQKAINDYREIGRAFHSAFRAMHDAWAGISAYMKDDGTLFTRLNHDDGQLGLVPGVWTAIKNADGNTLVFGNDPLNGFKISDYVKHLFTGDAAAPANDEAKIKKFIEQQAKVSPLFAQKLKRALTFKILKALAENNIVGKYTDDTKTTIDNRLGDNVPNDENWASFINNVTFSGKENTSAGRDFLGSLASSIGLDELFVSYDEDKDEFSAGPSSWRKLVNTGGAAGPRALWEVSQGGTILMSSNDAYTMQLKNEGDGHWEKISNPQPSLSDILNALNI